MMLFSKASLISVILFSSAIAEDKEKDLAQLLLGSWCLNTEEYDGEVSVDGTKWTFKEDGTYVYQQNYVSTDAYRLEGDTVHLDNFGEMKIVSISETEMVGKVYSTYHFTRTCLPIVEEAMRITQLNNAIIMKDMAKAKKLIEAGTPYEQPDTRSSMRSTPLMVAIQHGSKEMVVYLLTLNPKMDVTNSLGRTALDVAKKKANPEILNLIMTHLEQANPK